MPLFRKFRELAERFTGSDNAVQALDDEQMRVAAAALLLHTANIDGEVHKTEIQRVRRLLEQRFELDPGAASSLMDEAEKREQEAVDLYGFTSVLTAQLDRPGRLKIVEMLWEVVMADGIIHEFEANLVWRAAELLGVTSSDRIALRKSVEERQNPAE
ncbi:MAG: TerB family tellurite resistance protein [Pseudomonadota bacterium]|nr:TerB family tellurite resistance protein [Pseudomonadota bacterium]